MRTLGCEHLESRYVMAAGQWVAVFNSMAPADNLDDQALLGQNLLSTSGVAEQDARVVAALDLSGSFLVQAPYDSTSAAVSDALDDVPGFVYAVEFTAPGTPEEEFLGRTVTPARARSEAIYGPFDYDTFLLREKNGEFPDQGGVVLNEELGILTNNNGGATGTGGFTQSETSLVAFGDTVVVGYNDSGSNAGGANRFTGFSRSTDGGATFTDGGVLPTTPLGDAGDPVLARNNSTGRIYFSTLGFSAPGNIQMFRSDDNGVSWSAPVNATPGGSTEDKQWHTVDNFPGSGNGNVYLVSRRFGTTGGGPGIYFFRSTDHGNTFGPTNGTLIVAGSQGAFITVAPDHSINAFWYAGTTLQMRKSTDQGLTFGAPVTVASGLVGGTNGDLALTGLRQGTATFSGFRSNEFPHAVVNPANGHIYVTFANNPAGTDKANIYMVMSTTGGATWSLPVQVNDDVTLTDQWQPTLAVTPDGSKLGIFYYSRQEDPVNNNLFKFYGRIATIAGPTVTFAPSFAISNVASLPEFGRDTSVNTVYMSDYDTAVATPGAFHVVWSDNRSDLAGGSGRKDPNVFYEKISLGLAVTTTVPAVNSVVSTTPTEFTVNVSEPLDPLSVDPGDLTVNAIAANSVAYTPGATTMTFTYLVSPVSVQGAQTMSVAGGAFTRASDASPVAAFSGTFRYDTLALAVTSTTPPFPNGIFTLPGPFTYDVTFNEPVNPLSVQASDLQLAGIPGAFVSGFVVQPGETTIQFTIGGIVAEGTLTASIAAGQVTDAFGNPSNAFSAAYQVDIGTVPYPTPLAAKNPLGSLIYDPSIAGIVNFAGDSDSFTINIDANQTISLILTPTSPGLQPRIELFDPSNASMGFAVAPAAGQIAGVQTRYAEVGGEYRFAVSGASGTLGGFSLQLILNAAFELEGRVVGASNNSSATAQNLDASFLSVGPAAATAERGAALGTTESASGYTATAIPFAFTDISATGTTILQNVDDSTTTVTLPAGFAFSFYGVPISTLFPSSNGLIAFGSANSSFSNATLSANPTQAAIAPFWDDLYLFNATGTATLKSQIVGAVGSRQLILQWDKVNFFANNGADTLTFQVILSEGTNTIQLNYLDLTTAGDSRSEGTGATAGIKKVNPTTGLFTELINSNGPNAFVGSGKSTLLSPVLPTNDFYSLSLDAAQTTTIAVTSLAAGGVVNVDLIDSDGVTVLASGVGGASNLTRVISNFTVGVAGTYYAKVSGDFLVPYSIVTTKNSALDTEGNSTFASAQPLSGLEGALGAITVALGTAINAVDSGWLASDGTHSATNNNYFVGQANFNGNPLATLRNYFTFSLSPATPLIVGAELRLVNPTSGYGSPDLTETYSLFDVSATAAALDTTRAAGDPTGIAIHADLGSGVAYGSRVVSAADNGTTVAIALNAAAVAALNAAIGTTISFGGAITTLLGTAQQSIFGGTSGALGTVQLVLQTAAESDWYSIDVTSTDNALRLETSTAADGPGQFVNGLNPTIELYDPAGALVVAAGTVLGDGRNERIEYAPLMTGLYRARVLSQGGTTGEYFLARDFAPTVSVSVVSAIIEEADDVQLDGTIDDPDLLNSHTVTINWGPGEGSSTIFLAPGDLTFTATHTYADDNPTISSSDLYPIAVTVVDSHGAEGAVGTSITVNNAAPVMASAATDATPADIAVVGETVNATATYTDVGIQDTHTVSIDWGDGSPTTAGSASGGAAIGSHAYSAGGIYTVTMTVTDDDSESDVLTTTAYVTGVGVINGQLQIIGTNIDDHVSVNLVGSGGEQVVRVHASFLPPYPGFIDVPLAGIGSILLSLFDGDDHATLAGNMTLPAVLDGGAGADHLSAGGGGAVVLGGSGNDFLQGGQGNDILIGGTGADQLNGGSGEDILIGGTTSYDADDEALLVLLAEWTSTRPRPERVSNLRTGAGPDLAGRKLVKGTTVFDDGDSDQLIGASNIDWYFYLSGEDSVNGLGNGEDEN